MLARCRYDVIYTGLHKTPEEVVVAAVQEGVDVLGVSLLSGAHMSILPRLIEQLRQANAEDMLIVAGGVIPDEDVPALLKLGALTQDTSVDVIPQELRTLVQFRG